MFTPAPAIEAMELGKTYGKGAKTVHALAALSFTVEPGIVFGLLGPNGAGKSTTVRILTTLARPDQGRATVHGIDVDRHPERVRGLIGYVSQKPGFDPVATGLENLVLQGRIHGASARDARAARGRTAGSLRPDRGRTPAGRHLVRRHAAQARRGHGTHAPAAGAVPRRTHHRPGPAGADGPVGGDRPAGPAGRVDRAAHHALPGRGRPPGRATGHRGRRPGGRGRHPRPAQERAGRGHDPGGPGPADGRRAGRRGDRSPSPESAPSSPRAGRCTPG